MNNIRLSSNQVLQITNMLRLLGLKNSHIGTKLINKSIQYIVVNDIDFFTLEEIYIYLREIYNFNLKTIKNNISNSILNRDIQKSKANFESLFNYEYDEYFFSTKNFIEEIANVIRIKYI